MSRLSQKSEAKSSLQLERLLCFQSTQNGALRNDDNCSVFALRLINDLPVPAKAWASDLSVSEDYVRQIKRGDRNMTDSLATQIIKIADEYTTIYLSWKLRIDHYRQKGEILQ